MGQENTWLSLKKRLALQVWMMDGMDSMDSMNSMDSHDCFHTHWLQDVDTLP
jgi:hypothetical protein